MWVAKQADACYSMRICDLRGFDWNPVFSNSMHMPSKKEEVKIEEWKTSVSEDVRLRRIRCGSSSSQEPKSQLTMDLGSASYGNYSHQLSTGVLTPVMKAQRDELGSHLDPQELMGLCISSEQLDRRQRSRTPRSAPTEPIELPTQRFSWFSMIWGSERSISPEAREPSPPRGRSRQSRLHTCRKVEDLRSEARRT